MEPLTMGSLFDGIGGFPLAAVHNGIIPVWASEIEAFPIEVTRLRFPNMVHVGDVIIENQDFEVFIKHYDRPGGFIYCDPPYFSSEYVYDCGFTWEDHLRLHSTLTGAKGKFLLSYNDCPEIRELYDGCSFFDFRRIHSMVQKFEAGKEFPELLIANYDLYERQREMGSQLTLFDLYGEQHDYEKILKEAIVSCKGKR